MTGTAPPYSRWRIRASTDQLAKSHAAAADAVAALTRSVGYHRSADPRPTVSQRVAGRRGWPRTFWLSVTTLLTGLFMTWISVRLVRHLSVAPDIVAVLPGLLLTLALGGTSTQAAKSLESSDSRLPWTLFTVAVTGSVAWITLSLAMTTATPAWAALICGAAVAAAVASGMLAFSRSAVADAATGERTTARQARTIPRRLRAQRNRAHDRLRDHIRRWNLAAHQYSLVIAGSDQAALALTRLIAGDADPPLDGIDPYHTLLLTALCRCRPTPLMASLDVAMRHLNEVWPQGAAIGIRDEITEFTVESGRAPGT